MEFNDKVIDSKTLYKGHTLSLKIKKLRHETGLIYEREIIDRMDAVAVVAVKDSKVVLVKQFRPPIDKPLLELPAGLIENDDPEKTAYNELIEETGYKANKLKLLTKYYSSAGFTNEVIHIFEADDMEMVGARPEPEEFLEIVEMPLKEAMSAAKNGEITDAKTVIGLLLLETSS